jgi:ABC-type dipeptide/oligopeptide/nickel transport system ATPase subunit
MELALHDITVAYRRGGTVTRAVRGVSLRLARGETLALVGESGSGKTTIGKVAAGLQTATTGTLSWSGDGERSTRTVQMVFQHPVQSLDPMWTVRRTVQEPLRHKGVARGVATSAVADLVAQVGLDESILGRYPREISGGQAQRVAIARALVARPEIVILDEPTASLDQTVRGRILALLGELQAQTGVGYLLISHDISTVRRLASRVAVMHRGLLVESGPAETVLEHARHPYTRALIAAVPVADPRVRWDPAALPSYDSNSPCPIDESPCSRHGTGLHEVGPGHLVACTNGRAA